MTETTHTSAAKDVTPEQEVRWDAWQRAAGVEALRSGRMMRAFAVTVAVALIVTLAAAFSGVI